jgi:hypothetical protein
MSARLGKRPLTFAKRTLTITDMEDQAALAINLKAPCWIATRKLNKAGYVYVTVNGKSVRAHRYMWEQLRGPIPEGMELDHLCREKRCVNPQHLEPVTHLENCRRGLGGHNNRSKTHCAKGHEYTEANTYHDSKGRQCRTCRAQRDIESRPSRKAYFQAREKLRVRR